MKGTVFMRAIAKSISVAVLVAVTAVAVHAADIDALDRVSVLMPKSAVLSILGKPDSAHEMTGGLKIDLYTPTDTNHLVGAGYFYENDNSLGGHAFIFRGNVARIAADRLREHGFTLLGEEAGAYRLAGKDDDTVSPIVVTIDEQADLTTVITFDKGFYDRRVQK
jgi:hypothetical protein